MIKEDNPIERSREKALRAILVLKRENMPRIGRPYWTSPTGYNYGSWADRGFNIAIRLLREAKISAGVSAVDFLQNVGDDVRRQRDRFRVDERDEDGACSGALDAAMWAILDVAKATKEETSDAEASRAPASLTWRLMYYDTFDREMPPQVEAEGQGLASGLIELWTHFLSETVRPDGVEGFSKFYLIWDGPGASIRGEWEGAKRLHRWIFGEQKASWSDFVEGANHSLLERIASAHERLINEKRGSDPILTLASSCNSPEEFGRRLAEL